MVRYLILCSLRLLLHQYSTILQAGPIIVPRSGGALKINLFSRWGIQASSVSVQLILDLVNGTQREQAVSVPAPSIVIGGSRSPWVARLIHMATLLMNIDLARISHPLAPLSRSSHVLILRTALAVDWHRYAIVASLTHQVLASIVLRRSLPRQSQMRGHLRQEAHSQIVLVVASILTSHFNERSSFHFAVYRAAI